MEISPSIDDWAFHPQSVVGCRYLGFGHCKFFSLSPEFEGSGGTLGSMSSRHKHTTWELA
jgi:hypothetical protein